MLVVVLLGLACVCSGPAAASAAGKPVIERFEASGGPFVNEGLTEDCGFEVQVTFAVKVVRLTFPDGSQLIERGSGHNTLVFSANGNTVKFQEVVADVVKTAPDGTVTASMSGRSFLEGLIGHWVVNLDTDEFEFIGGKVTDRQQICTALAA